MQTLFIIEDAIRNHIHALSSSLYANLCPFFVVPLVCDGVEVEFATFANVAAR